MNFREAFKEAANRGYRSGKMTLGQRFAAGLILTPFFGGRRLKQIKKQFIDDLAEMKDSMLVMGDLTQAQYDLIDAAKMQEDDFDWDAFIEALIEFLMVILPLIFGALSILIPLMALSLAASSTLAQEITGPGEAVVGQKATFEITPADEGRHTLILVSPSGVKSHELTVTSEGPPPIKTAAAIIVEGDQRPFELGGILNDPAIGKYLGANGCLSVLSRETLDEEENTPLGLEGILDVEEIPALVLLDSENNVISTQPCPLIMEDLQALLPGVPDLPESPLLKVEELPAVNKDLPLPDYAQFQILVTPQGVIDLGDAEKAKTQFPFGLRDQPPLRAMDASFNVLPRNQWKETNRRHFVYYVYSQIDGMCTSNATVQCLMLQRAIQGSPDVLLSAVQLYGSHSNWGTGSTLWENLEEIRNNGVCDRETVPQNKWRRRHWPANYAVNAERHKCLMSEYFSGSSKEIFDKVATAIQRGYWCNIGIVWPGGGGHSIVALDLAQRNGEWGFVILNSWGEEWGDHGMAWLSEETCDTLDRFGAFAIWSATLPSDEVDSILAPVIASRPLRDKGQEYVLAP